MNAIFLFMFAGVIIAAAGKRSPAIYFVSLSLLFASFYFYHDITQHLTIQL